MERRPAFAVMALGAVLTLLGGTGIFAVFNDRATTGTNSVTSGARASAADLQIATATDTGGGIDCGTFVDDLQTGLFSISGAQPTDGSLATSFACLKNAGSSSLVSLSATALDLVDTETACTGDEATAGDATCGSGAGELSPVLRAEIHVINCTTSALEVGRSAVLADLATGGFFPPTPPLAPDDVACLRLGLLYPTDTPDTAVQIAQTDQATWRYAFDGTTA